MSTSRINRKKEDDLSNVYKNKLEELLKESKSDWENSMLETSILSTYRISFLPNLVADLFELIEGDNNLGIDNLALSWGIDHYLSRKIEKLIPKYIALYNFVLTKNVPMEVNSSTFVQYIPHDEYKILYFRNSHINYVCVLEKEFNKFHIRLVYDDLFGEESNLIGFYNMGTYPTREHLREGIKGEKGLEIALLNLNSKYQQWSDCVGDNQYPNRISLENMIKNNFGKECRAFKYGDSRDEGYILSYSSYGGRTTLLDYIDTKYILGELINSFELVPERFFREASRNIKLDELGI